MPIQFSCIECESTVRVPSNASGCPVRCPKCRTKQYVPDIEEYKRDALRKKNKKQSPSLKLAERPDTPTKKKTEKPKSAAAKTEKLKGHRIEETAENNEDENSEQENNPLDSLAMLVDESDEDQNDQSAFDESDEDQNNEPSDHEEPDAIDLDELDEDMPIPKAKNNTKKTFSKSKETKKSAAHPPFRRKTDRGDSADLPGGRRGRDRRGRDRRTPSSRRQTDPSSKKPRRKSKKFADLLWIGSLLRLFFVLSMLGTLIFLVLEWSKTKPASGLTQILILIFGFSFSLMVLGVGEITLALRKRFLDNDD